MKKLISYWYCFTQAYKMRHLFGLDFHYFNLLFRASFDIYCHKIILAILKLFLFKQQSSEIFFIEFNYLVSEKFYSSYSSYNPKISPNSLLNSQNVESMHFYSI